MLRHIEAFCCEHGLPVLPLVAPLSTSGLGRVGELVANELPEIAESGPLPIAPSEENVLRKSLFVSNALTGSDAS